MNFRPQVKHLYQTNEYNCGATSFASIFDCTIEEAEKIVNTRKTGTYTHNVCYALSNLGQRFSRVDIAKDFCEIRDDLVRISCKFPIYASCEFYTQGKRGRPRLERHAIVFANGQVYDPSEVRACPMDCFEHAFQKKLIVDEMIIIDHELPDFLQNFKLMTS
jgi:hypothetical protein